MKLQSAYTDRKQKNQSGITPLIKAAILTVKTRESAVCDLNHRNYLKECGCFYFDVSMILEVLQNFP